MYMYIRCYFIQMTLNLAKLDENRSYLESQPYTVEMKRKKNFHQWFWYAYAYSNTTFNIYILRSAILLILFCSLLDLSLRIIASCFASIRLFTKIMQKCLWLNSQQNWLDYTFEFHSYNYQINKFTFPLPCPRHLQFRSVNWRLVLAKQN